jgi:hypothetical protein
MHGFPKGVTVFGVVLAVAAVLVDPATVPFLAQLLGEHAATKVAALGAVLSALGRALQDRATPEPIAPPLDVDDTP